MSTSIKLFFEAAVVLVIMSLSSNCVTTANQTNSFNWTTCETRDSLVCKCTSDVIINVIARCQFKHVTDLNVIINVRQTVVRLTLSGNNIQEIPRFSFKNFTQLTYLSLSSNNIHTISQGAFNGLTRLRELNLKDNIIKHWDTTLIQQDLPNLSMLNIARNIYWKPDQQILSLPNLKIIYLFIALHARNRYWEHFGCHLIRNHTKLHGNHSFTEIYSRNIKEKVEPRVLLFRPDECWYQKFFLHDTSYWDVIEDNGFYFHCETVQSNNRLPNKSRETYNVTHLEKWYYFKEIIAPYCWNSMKKIHVIILVEGICTMVFNLIVIITTLRSRVLRESVAHVLVANIALGDLLTSFYMIIITTTRQSMSSDEFFYLYLPYFCRIVGLFFLIGQFSSPMMSFIMTLERYLAVVYCMKPHINITMRMCYVAIVTVWSLSVSLAVSFMTSPQFSKKTDRMCVPLHNVDQTIVMIYVGGIGVVLYILAIALYGHMYLDFKKTNQKTVQLQGENRLARRIALIMFTNVLFFILPLIAIWIINFLPEYISIINRYIVSKTFGLTCLGINSCFNPILFSFRNEKFRNEFRRYCFLCHNSVSNQP